MAPRYPDAIFLGKAVHSRGTFKKGRPTGILQHYTAGGSGKQTAKMLQGKNAGPVSCHFTIDRDGTNYQCGELDQVLFHAGVSKWRDQVGLNEYFIGIENANYGYWRPGLSGVATLAIAIKKGWVRARHKNGGGELYWEPYPEPQMEENLNLCKWLLKTFPSIKEDPLGHDDVSPGRKSDPGPAFPWTVFKGLLVPLTANDAGKYKVIAAAGLILRGGPGPAFEKLRTLPKGSTVTLLQDKGEWSFVKDAKGEGWVFDQYIAPA